MGGAVSSGRDNNELIDNLMSGNYIRSQGIERVFRALDRADYMTPEARDQAYKDLAWRNGPLHLSSPCIYSEVMEGLELTPGLSFLNIGSGTGYLSTLAGLILGTAGISHGVELHPTVYEYAVVKIGQFIENSPILDDFDFCEPKFFHGNGLCITSLNTGYDRVYCGAGCPEDYENYFKRLIKVGGILVMPLKDKLLQIRRVADNKWTSRNLLSVSFTILRLPSKEESSVLLKLDEQTPVRLQLLARAAVRAAMRRGVVRRHPELRETPRAPPPPACPRRICIPIEPGGAVEGLNVLHDLDNENGANEMNALLSLVISMGHNRVADALRFDQVEWRVESGETSEEENENDNETEPANNGEEPDREQGNNNNQSEPRSDNSSDHPRDTSDSDDPRPPRPRNKRPSKTDKKRHRRSRDDDDDSALPPGCKVLLSYKDVEPSTSNKEVQTSSEELTDSPRKSSESDSAHCSTQEPSRPRDLPGVPSEVEIDLGSKIAQASTSNMEMEWEENKTDDDDDDDDEVEMRSKAKRQKLDSGIGDATPSTSSPDKSKTEFESDYSERSAGTSSERSGSTGRRLRRKARSSGEGGAGGGGRGARAAEEEEVEACVRAHLSQRRRRVARGGDARRVRLSLLMKQAVKELPLPHALKKFVNLGRCFEF